MNFDWQGELGVAASDQPVMPGEFYCTVETTILSSVLGSCIAVCLWDSVRKLGGMSHFVLPRAPEGLVSARYGDVAITCLRNGLARLGAGAEALEARVFGGADVLAFSSHPSVAADNVALALDCLHAYLIPVTAQRTGGKRGRMIKFHTGTGEVFVRPIPVSRVIHAAGPERAA